MKFRLLLIVLFITTVGFSQKAELDSLWSVWQNEKQQDTTRLNALYDFVWDGYLFNKPDSAYYFSKFMKSFAIEKKSKKYEAKANNLQGTYFYNTGDYKNSMVSAVKTRDDNKQRNAKIQTKSQNAILLCYCFCCC